MTDGKTLYERRASINSIGGQNVIMACTARDGCDVSISLGDKAIQEIEKLEQYAILARRRIDEFRVG